VLSLRRSRAKLSSRTGKITFKDVAGRRGKRVAVVALARRDEVNDIVADYGHVIVDECHHE
jgi:hypothetical protein